MRYKRKVGAVTRLKEDGHQGNETNHGVLVVRVDFADDDAHDASNDADKVDPQLLCPQIAVRRDVDPVSNEASKRASDNIEKTEHGCPATGLCLAEVGEVLEVVCAKDGVDGELGTEGVEVAESEHSCLWGQDDLHCLLDGGLLDDFVLVAVDDLNVASSRLNVAMLGSDVLLLVARGDGAGSSGLIVETSSSGNDGLVVLVRDGCSLDDGATVGPFAGGCVVSEEQKTQGNSGNQDEWDDERDPPRHVGGQVLLRPQGVVNGRHGEAGSG